MDWRHAQLVVAALATIVILPAALFIRVPPVLAASAADEGQGDVAVGSSGATSVARAMRTPHFIVLAIVFFCCCATHAGPTFPTVSYSIGCGLPTMAPVPHYSSTEDPPVGQK